MTTNLTFETRDNETTIYRADDTSAAAVARIPWESGTIGEHFALVRMFIAAPRMLAALQAILDGSDHTGRWLDPDGDECAEDDEGAYWCEFDENEQAAWLETVTSLAEEAIAAATSAPTGEPAAPTACAQDGPYSPELAQAFRTAAAELCNSDTGDRILIEEGARVEEMTDGDGGVFVHCKIYVSDRDRALLAGEVEG